VAEPGGDHGTSRLPNSVVRIRALLPSLPRAEQRVASKVIEDPAGVSAMTITELAQSCDTSETTVIRFCRAVGFSGYPQLRLTLATEVGRAEGSDSGRRVVSGDISPGDSLEQVVEKIAFADARAVEDTASQLDITVLERVIDAIVAARRVDIYGVAASGGVAVDLQQKLHRIGKTAFAWSDTHVALTSAALLREHDVAIGISHTGVTLDTIDALAEARRRGATTVALTNFPRSPIADVADLVLTTAARETTFRSGATASRLAQLTVVDCVFVGVAKRTYDETLTALTATHEAVRSRHLAPERGRK
jgi:DNA-binding MurR/RpiR family transcriptional regulator